MSGEIEDESHFVVDCALYDDLGEKFKNVLMKEGIEFEEERKTEAGKKLMQLLLGTGLHDPRYVRLRQRASQWARRSSTQNMRRSPGDVQSVCRHSPRASKNGGT